MTATAIRRFDVSTLHAAIDERRAELGLSWRQVANQIWQQSAELNERRREEDLTWRQLAELLGCSPGQLTALRTAKYATGMDLAMRITQWTGRPAADFIYPARW